MIICRKKYLLLKEAKTKSDLAHLLEVSASFLTRVLYHPGVSTHYNQFSINKKSGGMRVIHAPSAELKNIQRRLSDLLQDCNEVICLDTKVDLEGKVSHGFERKRSIITNALVHKGKKNVLNLDLDDFFGCFNFGRVRGYFISNKNYKLDPSVATVIAQIACHNNCLPQGSPCSPVIANLITNSLDIRLLRLAKRDGCSYSRYADDLTFSTRKNLFPTSIVKEAAHLELGEKLLSEIRRAGFSVNMRKTRLQYKDSRQEATGLVINKKVSIKAEYWRLTRAMADRLFKSGAFEIVAADGKLRSGTLSELEGRLTFIDSIDHLNNLIENRRPIPSFGTIKQRHGLNGFKEKHNSREAIYSRFLFYKNFYANEYPTILTEGKTDNIYLKSALFELQRYYPDLIKDQSVGGSYRPNLRFPNLNGRMMYFLDLGSGATPFLRFVKRYKDEHKQFHGNKARSPVILVLDNDSGPNKFLNDLASEKSNSCPNDVPTIKSSGFLHVFENLYLILTPLKKNGGDSSMEDMFDSKTLNTQVNGKKFSRENSFDKNKYYGKNYFATKVIKSNASSINFDRFKYIFDEIKKVTDHFSKL